MADQPSNTTSSDRKTFRKVIMGTFWFTACLILFLNPIGLWPYITYLALFSIHLTVVDEGYEAHLMRAELRRVLGGG